MPTLGLKEERKTSVEDTPLTRQTDKEMAQAESEKATSIAVISFSMLLAFLVSISFRDDKSIFEVLGNVFGVAIIAGIGSAIAAKFTRKWWPVWLILSLLAVSSGVVSRYYKERNEPTMSNRGFTPSNVR